MAVIIKLLLVALAITLAYGSDNENNGFIDLPGEQVFTDRSALADQSNIQSPEYQDFIRGLYKFDKDNLQKYDSIFEGQTAPIAAS